MDRSVPRQPQARAGACGGRGGGTPAGAGCCAAAAPPTPRAVARRRARTIEGGVKLAAERARVISVEHLTKYYGTYCAVDDVSFTIGRGEVAALLGPNGSGKTTLMRVLTGYFPPTAGRVCIDGEDVAEQPAAARRRIGYLPEQVSLYPELTVRRYLAFVAEVKGLDGRARRAAVAGAIERCGLVSVADRLAGKLSKGYRQRVGLAQALVGDADVLVLDEPP